MNINYDMVENIDKRVNEWVSNVDDATHELATLTLQGEAMFSTPKPDANLKDFFDILDALMGEGCLAKLVPSGDGTTISTVNASIAALKGVHFRDFQAARAGVLGMGEFLHKELEDALLHTGSLKEALETKEKIPREQQLSKLRSDLTSKHPTMAPFYWEEDSPGVYLPQTIDIPTDMPGVHPIRTFHETCRSLLELLDRLSVLLHRVTGVCEEKVDDGTEPGAVAR